MKRIVLTSALLVVSIVAMAGQPTKRPSDAERGKELYDRHCVSCHGEAARGDGPATAALVAPVPNLHKKVKADEATVRIVMRGRNAMPSFEQSFDKADTRRVLRYMAKLSGQKPAPAVEPVEDDVEEVDDAGQDAGPRE